MNDPIPYDLIVLHYGELFLKGDNRPRFEAVLEENVRRALKTFSIQKIDRGQGRLFVSCDASIIEPVAERVRRVFGFAAVSLAISVSQDMESIANTASTLVKRIVSEREHRTFRISARRSDKRFPIPSPEIGRLVGERVFMDTGLEVNLTRPELNVFVEIGNVRNFVSIDRLVGAGGLPVGISGHVALLLSGGIDSPVAGYLMQKRGCTLRAIYFHSPPYTGSRTRAKVEKLANTLAFAQGEISLDVIPFTTVQTIIRDKAPHDMAVILYRRAMMRISSILAQRSKCIAIATGENLGQVASQTLENLSCIELAAALPVLRPLLTYDKAETTLLSQRIGTYALSIEPYEDCCSLFIPKHPVTRAQIDAIQRAESHLDLGLQIEEAAAHAETVTFQD